MQKFFVKTTIEFEVITKDKEEAENFIGNKMFEFVESGEVVEDSWAINDEMVEKVK
jgi:hypothetical protein